MSAVLANAPEAQCGKKNMKDLNSKVSLRDGHVIVIFHLDSYSKTELKELKDKFISDLQCVRNFINRIELGTIGQKRTMPVTSDDKETKRRKCTLNKETTAAMMRMCNVILAKLMKHKNGWVFNEPVDVVALGLPDYYQVIKHPMDLGTIKMKLGKRGYGAPIDFAKDVRLTFHNAMLYNRQGEDVHNMAIELLDMFDELFNPAYEKYKVECQRVIVEQKKFSKPLAENKPSQVVSSQQNTEKPLQVYSQAALPKTLSKEDAKKSVSKTKKTVPEAKENPQSRKEMSDCERDKLGLVLQDLAVEYLNEILQIVAKRNSKMATPGEDGEIELDVQALDSETVWDLHRFARLHLKVDQDRTTKEEITSQSTSTLENNKFTHEPAMPTTPKIDEDIDIGDEMPVNDYPPVVIERDNTPCPASNVRSSNSSSSSSGTDSSSGKE